VIGLAFLLPNNQKRKMRGNMRLTAARSLKQLAAIFDECIDNGSSLGVSNLDETQLPFEVRD